MSVTRFIGHKPVTKRAHAAVDGRNQATKKGGRHQMSSLWMQVCKFLIAILEELVALDPGKDHTVIARAGLTAAKHMLGEGDKNA